jgi:hypothetical protein
MNPELSSFAARLIPLIREPGRLIQDPNFDELARELFALQFRHNPAYRRVCEARNLIPATVDDWTQIPAIPTAAFKELELTSLSPDERTAVFHSSGTTEQKPSRHFHGRESLAVYQASLESWFLTCFGAPDPLLVLTPTQQAAPRSSLVHMFEAVRVKSGQPESVFAGRTDADGAWIIDFIAVILRLESACATGEPVTLLGTAFSFVHLLDYLVENDRSFRLPEGSRVMETGGYKNRSRTMPKAELHAFITARLGVSRDHIICEYGMSELSSQAYDSATRLPSSIVHPRLFHFPPWARARIISPETGRDAAEGERGLIQVFDLANVFSVAAVQTEDLGVRRGSGFELIGRSQIAEPRGCSLMTA